MKLNLIKEIADIIRLSLQRDLSPKEEEKLKEWLKQDQARQIWYDKLLTNWKKDVDILHNVELDGLWRKIEARKSVPKFPMRSIKWFRAAAAVLIIIAVGWTVRDYLNFQKVSIENFGTPGIAQAVLTTGDKESFLLTPEKETVKILDHIHVQNDTTGVLQYNLKEVAKEIPSEEHRLHVPRGGEYQLKLSDGTKVWLNAESTLTYSSLFGSDERLVHLKGEAFFEVAKEANRTFIVRTNQMDIEVLGTSFNVRVYDNEKAATATLIEGSIKIKDRTGKITPLISGQQFLARPHANATQVLVVNTKNIAAWKDDHFAFKNKTLSQIMETVSRWYDIEYQFLDDKSRNYKFTGSINRKNQLSIFLEIIQKTSSINMKLKKNILQISSK